MKKVVVGQAGSVLATIVLVAVVEGVADCCKSVSRKIKVKRELKNLDAEYETLCQGA